jgi:hypothetical protein
MKRSGCCEKYEKYEKYEETVFKGALGGGAYGGGGGQSERPDHS